MTVHDLNFMEGDRYSNWRKALKLWILQAKEIRADALVFISNYSKNQANKYLKIPPVKRQGNHIQWQLCRSNCTT